MENAVEENANIDDLVIHPENPRIGNVEAIARSIEENGWFGTVVVQRSTSHVCAGNHRVKAARLLGMKTIPVYWKDCDDQQALKILLADNRVSDLAYNEDAKLAELLQNLEVQNALLGTGYDSADLGDLIDSLPEWPSVDLDDSPPPDSEPAMLLAERFGAPPFSVLDTRQGYWRDRKQQWLSLGIHSEIGRSANLLHMSDSVLTPQFFDKKAEMERIAGRELTAAEVTEVLNSGLLVDNDGESNEYDGGDAWQGGGTSVFDPVLCEIAYRWWCVPKGTVVDPFAGGSVRGIVASKLGYSYYGLDLRPEQVKANEEQGVNLLGEARTVEWRTGDSTDPASWEDAPTADFVFTCPPYGDLEIYSDDPADLSNAADDDEFFDLLTAAFANADAVLSDDRFAVIVMGEVRDPATGAIRDMVGRTIDSARAVGWTYYQDAILLTSAGSLPLRAGRIFNGGRKLGRTHQYVLVFVKGEWRKAHAACGPFAGDEFGLIEGSQ